MPPPPYLNAPPPPPLSLGIWSSTCSMTAASSLGSTAAGALLRGGGGGPITGRDAWQRCPPAALNSQARAPRMRTALVHPPSPPPPLQGGVDHGVRTAAHRLAVQRAARGGQRGGGAGRPAALAEGLGVIASTDRCTGCLYFLTRHLHCTHALSSRFSSRCSHVTAVLLLID